MASNEVPTGGAELSGAVADATVAHVSNGPEIEMTEQNGINGDLKTDKAGEDKVVVEDDEKAMAEAADIPPGGAGAISRFNFIMLFVGLALAVFLAALDQTIVSLAIPSIITEFQTVSGLSWIGVAYFLTSIPFIPTYGELADIFGRKSVFLFAIFLFELGSALCGAATSMNMLIIGRAIAGLGGGAIFSLVLIIIADFVPIEKRGAYAGIIGACFGVSSVVGPLLGGVFTETVSWRWCFYINLPIGAITVLTVVFFMKIPRNINAPEGTMLSKLRTIDWSGTMLLAVGSIFVLIGLTSGGVDHPWNSAYVISFIVIGAVICVLFGIWEARIKTGILRTEFYRDTRILAAFFCALMAGTLFFGIIYFVPVYFQAAQGQSPTQAGISTIPLVLAVVVGNIASGAAASITGHAWPFIPVGSVIAAVGAGMLSTLDLTSSSGAKIGYLILTGFGCGFLVQMVLLVAQGSTTQENVALITANTSFWQVLGAVIGLTVLSVIYTTTLTSKLLSLFPPGTSIDAFVNQPSLISGLPAEVRVPVQQAYVETLSLMFKVSITFAGLLLIGSLFMKRTKLGKDALAHGGGMA